MGKKCIGIDVGGTAVKIGLFEDTGEILRKWEIVTRSEDRGAHILDDAAGSIRRTLKDEGIAMTDIRGAGLGVPGPVTADGHVPRCVNLGWGSCCPGQQMSRLLDGIPVKCGNDANVAALGEMWQGGGRGYKDLVMITLGTGVGGGVVINEKIVAGRHGIGGEIGHMHVRESETERCNCGGMGCLEQTASATGIVREAGKFLAASDRPSLLRETEGALTAKDVLDAAKAGDKIALEVMDIVCHYLGIALAAAAQIVDPEIFVIGGGVSKAGPFLIDLIREHYEKNLTLSVDRPLIGQAKLGNDAGIYGCARLVLD